MEEEKKKKNLLGFRKKSGKRCKKKNLLSKVVDYLMSDDYMFAPILSAPASGELLPKQQALVTIDEGKKKKKQRMVDEVWEYLMSDSYMYGPCNDDDARSSSGGREAKISDSSSCRSDDRRVELTESAAAMRKRVSEVRSIGGTAVKRARVVEQHHQAVKKYMVYQSCRS